MGALGFTGWAHVEIRAYYTFVSDSNNGRWMAFITSDMGVDYFWTDFREFNFLSFDLDFLNFGGLLNFALTNNLLLNFWNDIRHEFEELLIDRVVNALYFGDKAWSFLLSFKNNFGNFNFRDQFLLFDLLNGFFFNNDLLGLIVEIFRALLDLNSDLGHSRFKEDSHINIIEKANHIFVAVLVS